jgi:transcriptional regulator with XRE-family HTH domain
MENTPTKNSRSGRLKGVYPDGNMIRDLRLAKGWQQQQLADKANVPLRSVQRAEEGKHRMSPAMLENIAHALEVDFDKVTVAEPSEQQTGVQPSDRHDIRLSPTVSADEILTLFQWIERVEFRLKGDFDSNQAEKIAETFELIEMLHRCRWTDEISYPDQIRKQGKLNDLLKSLSATGLRIFIGTYTCRLTGWTVNEDTDEIPQNVFKVEVSTHGLVTASFAKQRTITYTPFTGDSEEFQARQIRKRIAAGGVIYRWPGRLGKLRRELELEFGRELRSWKDDESPFS